MEHVDLCPQSVENYVQQLDGYIHQIDRLLRGCASFNK